MRRIQWIVTVLILCCFLCLMVSCGGNEDKKTETRVADTETEERVESSLESANETEKNSENEKSEETEEITETSRGTETEKDTEADSQTETDDHSQGAETKEQYTTDPYELEED